MDVTVSIINYNTKDLTLNCIRSVYFSKTKYSYEIIVVDNASSDGSVETIRTLFPKVIIIENKRNRGFAHANNQSTDIAKGRYFYILNSDTEIEENVIESVVTYGDLNKDVGVIGTKVVFLDGKLQENFYRFPTFLSELIFFTVSIIKSNDCFLFNLNKYRGYKRDKPFEVDVISGCSMFVKREVYNKVGLFNEDFFMYYEDVEFCFRVNKSNFKSVYFPLVCIKHIHMGSAREERDEFKILISCFDAACIYFTCARGRMFTLLFKIASYFLWTLEIVMLKIIHIIVPKQKVERKINMLKELLRGVSVQS